MNPVRLFISQALMPLRHTGGRERDGETEGRGREMERQRGEGE